MQCMSDGSATWLTISKMTKPSQGTRFCQDRAGKGQMGKDATTITVCNS